MTASKVPYTAPAYNSLNWNTPIDSQFNTISSALGTLPSIGVSSGYALSLTEATNLGFNLTGALTANVIVTIPNGTIGSWIFANNTSTTTSNTVTIAVAGSSGATYTLNAGPNAATILYTDGTNVYSAISGSGALYLPTTGGTLTGALSFNGINSILNLSNTTTSSNPNKFSGYSVIPSGGTLEFQSGSTLLLNGTFSPATLTVAGASGGTSTSTTLTVSKGQIAVASGGALTLGTTTAQSNQLAIGSGGSISIGGSTAGSNQIVLPSGGGIGINAAPTTNQLNISSGNITVAASSSSVNALAVTSGTASFANAVTLSSAPSASTDAVNKSYADTHILGSPSSGSFASPAIIGQAIVATSTSGTGSPTWGNVVGPTSRATLTTAGVTVGSSGAPTKIPFNATTFETNAGAFNTTSNSFVPTVGGYYQINASLLLNATGTSITTYALYAYIYKNGSLYSTGGNVVGVVVNSASVTVSDIVYLNGSSDSIQIYGALDTTGTSPVVLTPATSTFFNATFIHP